MKPGAGRVRPLLSPNPKSVGIETTGKHLSEEDCSTEQAIEGRSQKDARAVRMLDQKARFSRKGFVRAPGW
jgi:hypothetical protein